MLRVKSFNERHRKLAPVTTFFTLILVALLSFFLTLAEKICAIFSGKGAFWKRTIGVILAAVLLLLVIRIKVFRPQAVHDGEDIKGSQNNAAEVVLEDKKETTEAGDVKANEVSTADASLDEPSKAGDSTAEEIDRTDACAASTSADEHITGSEATDAGTSEASQTDMAEADRKENAEAERKETTETAAAATADATDTVSTDASTDVSADASTAATGASWDTSDADLEKFMKDYPETVGWVYFEDGHISYPIMQSSDNLKYKLKDYTGVDSRTGAIFLDFRSAPDFGDYNSIIYGHNMKDRTMFGTLRDYREDPGYYNDHQYFQVILPGKKYRYQIFAYMDVPESYVLYDYVGKAAYDFVKDAEPVRIKSYMDSEIPVNTSTRVVTLSTCTDKDDLQFVILGVLVDEK